MNPLRLVPQAFAATVVCLLVSCASSPLGGGKTDAESIMQKVGFSVPGLPASDAGRIVVMSQVTEKMSSASVANMRASIDDMAKAVGVKVEAQTQAGYVAALDQVLASSKSRLDALDAQQKALLQSSADRYDAALISATKAAGASVLLGAALKEVASSISPEDAQYVPQAVPTGDAMLNTVKNASELVESASSRGDTMTAFRNAAGLKQPSAKDITSLANSQLAAAKVGATISEEGETAQPAADPKKEEGGFKLPF